MYTHDAYTAMNGDEAQRSEWGMARIRTESGIWFRPVAEIRRQKPAQGQGLQIGKIAGGARNICRIAMPALRLS
ncbi:hypothetical protein [Sphingopyxis sp. LK2115]|jgi:hypothetical protein|uniref:hypothetical protein n=1 Tax=Sphingopyxis sp. LK2115 TaxID=2744558 RepID=UPI001660EC7A|nr:hypothetical protein [Sphingopyxis sp. LK2115]